MSQSTQLRLGDPRTLRRFIEELAQVPDPGLDYRAASALKPIEPMTGENFKTAPAPVYEIEICG